MTETAFDRILQAYEQIAIKAKYRPAAPGDGMGGIFLDADELSDAGILRKEAIRYVHHFQEEEDTRDFWIGCSCFNTVKAFVYVIEAARCLCAGHDFQELAVTLLRMATEELKRKREGSSNVREKPDQHHRKSR